MRCMGTTQEGSLETLTVEDVLKVIDTGMRLSMDWADLSPSHYIRLVLEHLGQPVVFDRRYGRVQLLLLLLLLLLGLVLVLEL